MRPCDSVGDHCRGVAIDVMVYKDRDLGESMVDVMSPGPAVWHQVFDLARDLPQSERTDLLDGRSGSPTQNHFDHIHHRLLP